MPAASRGIGTEAGWDLLADGRWPEARAAFERSAARAEDPRTLEGLSWAAWWLDDERAAFAAREGAYRLYREAGDAASAARMATWLAIDELDFHGAMAVANGWLRRARRLLERNPEPGADHGWLAFMEGYIALAAGQMEQAERLGGETAALGRRLAVADLEMLGLALEGSALVARARVEEGMHRLDEASAAALEGDAAIPISGAWACCFMVTACTAVRDYERASAWCDRIADFAERYGSRYMLAFCRAEYAAVNLWRGRWTDAEALLEASIDDFSRSRPAMATGPLAALAELRRRQGRGEEAEGLLRRVGASPAAQLCRARMALDRGDSLRAAGLVERLLRQLPEHLGPQGAPGLELLVRIRIARGDLEGAGAAYAELGDLERLVATPALQAAASLAAGMIAAAEGAHEQARPLLEDAVDRLERCGGAYDAAQARTELATTLLALGRAEEAATEAAAAAQALDGLGAAPDVERARRLLRAASGGGDAAPPAVTRRERDVLALLAEGLTNRQIAERLVVSEHTVHRHVTNLLRKLELPSRTAAAAYAVRAGLDRPPSG